MRRDNFDRRFQRAGTFIAAVHIILVLFWLALLGLGAWATYEIATSGITPESFGAFFGRIASGFNEAAQ